MQRVFERETKYGRSMQICSSSVSVVQGKSATEDLRLSLVHLLSFQIGVELMLEGLLIENEESFNMSNLNGVNKTRRGGN